MTTDAGDRQTHFLRSAREVCLIGDAREDFQFDEAIHLVYPILEVPVFYNGNIHLNMHFIKWAERDFSVLRDLQECFPIYVIYHVSFGVQDAPVLHAWSKHFRATNLRSFLMSDAGHKSSPVRHIVMWNVAGDTTEERATAVEIVRNAFEALRGRIPGLISLEVGIDHSRIDYACDMVLVTDFDSEASLQAYATHPLHLAVRGQLQGVRVARYQVDYCLRSMDAA